VFCAIYCSLTADPRHLSSLQLPCNGSFFHNIILFCGLFKTERFHCISVLLHRPERLNYSCRKLAAENTSSIGTIIYRLPFLVFQCIRFILWRNYFTLTAEVKEHFHTMNNKDGSKAYFS